MRWSAFARAKPAIASSSLMTSTNLGPRLSRARRNNPKLRLRHEAGLPTMKALIVYDDATCAAATNAILHRAADRADISVKWDVRPWRLNMLRFTPTAEEIMSDAADAHLIVFAIHKTQSLPAWLMKWLERWALLRRTPGAALAIIGCGTAEASVEMRQFACRFGLSFIWEGQKPQLNVGFLTEA